MTQTSQGSGGSAGSGGGRAAGGGLSLKKKILYSFVVTATFALLTFAIAECWVRLNRPHLDLWTLTGRQAGMSPLADWASIDAFCAYRGKPGRYPLQGGVYKTINSQGFISTPEIGYEKEPGEIRVVFLGESSTAGTGKDLPDEQTWPWKTMQMVRERLPNRKITFINAAMGGYTSFESFGRFWSRVRFYNPDIVISNHGWNDLSYFQDVELARTWRVREDGSWGFDESVSQICRPLWVDHIFRYSQLLTRVRWRLAVAGGAELEGGGAPETKATTRRSGWDHRAIEVWRTNVRLLRDTSKLLDTTLFICKQPTLVVEGLSLAQQKRCGYAHHHFGHGAHVSAYKALYQVIDEEMPKSQIIDLTPLSGRPELFQDHVHQTTQGTSEIAAMVSQQLVEYLEHQPVGEKGTSRISAESR